MTIRAVYQGESIRQAWSASAAAAQAQQFLQLTHMDLPQILLYDLVAANDLRFSPHCW